MFSTAFPCGMKKAEDAKKHRQTDPQFLRPENLTRRYVIDFGEGVQVSTPLHVWQLFCRRAAEKPETESGSRTENNVQRRTCACRLMVGDNFLEDGVLALRSGVAHSFILNRRNRTDFESIPCIRIVPDADAVSLNELTGPVIMSSQNRRNSAGGIVMIRAGSSAPES